VRGLRQRGAATTQQPLACAQICRSAEAREWSAAAFWRANVVLLLVEMDDDGGGAQAMLIARHCVPV
jgi:hypothetical protein